MNDEKKFEKFEQVAKQVKIEHLYDKLNLQQLINLSRSDRRTKEKLGDLIKRRKIELFINNYTALYNAFETKNKHSHVMAKIVSSYGSNKYLFEFLYKFLKIRAHSRYNFNLIMNHLERLFHNINQTPTFLKFKNNKYVVQFHDDLPQF